MQKKKERVDYVDVFRGLGIILMVMSHVGFGQVFDHFIHAFHMPMFFFASGYFFRIKELRLFLGNKCHTLLLPFLSYTLIIYSLGRIILNQPEDSLLHVIVFMNSTDFVAAALWFLPALFCANLFYYVMRKWSPSDNVTSIVVACVAYSGCIVHRFYEGALPFALDSAAVGAGMMHIGYLANHDNRVKKPLQMRIIPTIVVGGILVVLVFQNVPVNMRTGAYGMIPLFWINAVGCTIVLWNISRRVENATKYSSLLLNHVINIIKTIGKHSLIFLCLNQVAITFWFEFVPSFGEQWFCVLVHNMIILFFVLVTCYFVAWLYERINKNAIYLSRV